MRVRTEVVEELHILYRRLEAEIRRRLEEFRSVPEQGLERVFEELCFCLLTPQTKARAADSALRELCSKGLLLRGRSWEIEPILRKHGVRFPKVKAERIVEARRHLSTSFLAKLLELAEKDPAEARELLVKNVRGLGYKEASHFLRNIGFSGLAILDRHILRTLHELGALKSIPKTLSKKRYLEIEKTFREAAETLGIPIDSLDLLMWARKRGEVFK